MGDTKKPKTAYEAYLEFKSRDMTKRITNAMVIATKGSIGHVDLFETIKAMSQGDPDPIAAMAFLDRYIEEGMLYDEHRLPEGVEYNNIRGTNPPEVSLVNNHTDLCLSLLNITMQAIQSINEMRMSMIAKVAGGDNLKVVDLSNTALGETIHDLLKKEGKIEPEEGPKCNNNKVN